ncbi:MAG: hypothetical protein U9Q81_09715 [Pseudomonadota bacterium]|nr:hypothetical protein [Pseudomonadota bacterium]
MLKEYAGYLPLTIRQIFYRLVGKDIIGKTEKDYNNLGELLNRARRAQVIDMGAIRDDGFTGGFALRNGFTGPDEFLAATVEQANDFRRDRQEGQERRLVLWCEATGMVPQLERVAATYGVMVKSSGGFDSLTVKHQAGRMTADVPIEVLHVGDFDPSGECMFDALAEDVTAFAEHYGNDVLFSRVAVTPEHIALYHLPTAPPKASSHQAKKRMSETTQAEALDPATLADIVREGIEDRMDEGAYRQAVEIEQHERKWLLDQLQTIA